MKAPVADVASSNPLSRRRIVGYNPSLTVFACCGLVGVFVFSWEFLASPPNDTSNLLNVLPPLCFIALAFPLIGSCRVVVDPSGFIDVINPVVTRRVPISELTAVEHDDGLRLRVASGRRIGSVAYGSSLLGTLLHYPRSARAARRIEAAIGGVPGGIALKGWHQDTVSSRPRVRALLSVLGINVVLVLGTFALNAAETAAQR